MERIQNRMVLLSTPKKKFIALRTIAVAAILSSLSSHPTIIAFAPKHSEIRTACRTTITTTKSSTELSMVFDFFKQRSEEGIEQLSKLTDAASKGNLGQGLAEVAEYTQATNEAFAEGLAKSRNSFLSNFDGLFGRASPPDNLEDLLEDLQDVLLQADLGVATSEDIVNEVKSLSEATIKNGTGNAKKPKLMSREDLMSVMRGVLIETLDFEQASEPSTTESINDSITNGSSCNNNITKESKYGASVSSPNGITGASAIRFSRNPKIPTILFVMGANGMGKTTTIGKLANRLRVEGDQKVLLAACDTFRAGAVDQLQMWANRAEVDLIGPDENSSSTPTTIAVEACQKAVAEGYDTVLIDTAGRLSNNWELNEELVKMKAAIGETILGSGEQTEIAEAAVAAVRDQIPHEALLVLDAAQGRMALDSARVWNKEIGLTGLVLTKLDGTARGGSVVAISKDLNLPVKLIGVGESIDDLRDFDGEKFVDGLLGIGSAGGNSNSQSEGAALASRLEALRKERAKRTPVVSVQQSTVETMPKKTFNHVAPQGARPTSGNNKRRNRRKKGKKGKR